MDLNIYHWELFWKITILIIFGKQGKKRDFPDFRLNLFIQAKWPFLHTGTGNKSIYNCPYYSFKINDHQQKVLEQLVNVLGKRVLIVYASPVFGKLEDLYLHTRNGDIVENTSFPKISQLSGHNTWNYCSADKGIACS